MMKKLISGRVLLAMLACLVLPAAAAEPTALPMTVAEAVDGVSAYCTAAMQAAGTYSDWSILQLARSGNLTDAMRQDYLASLAEKLRACGGVLDKSYYTQYSRTILALTACGENARDFAGYDLTAPLANYDQTVWQGVNGAAFALIAMDSVSYGFAASGTSSRARLVAYLLAQELPGGGWDYSGKTADPDQTAMVLQALAPYRTQANVSAAIDRALNVLSGMQKDDGSFDAWGASSSESISQVLVALCALGIDPAKDSRFVRANGAWLVSALMSFRVQTETGLAFGHTNRTANYMATVQAGYALAAYERFLVHHDGHDLRHTHLRPLPRHGPPLGAALCLRGDGAGPHEWRRQRLLRSRGNAEPCHARHDPLARFRQPRSRRRQFFRRPGRAVVLHGRFVGAAERHCAGRGRKPLRADGQHHARAARRYALARLRQPREHAEPCGLPGCRDVLRLGEHGAGVGRGARHSERHGRQTGPRRHGDASAGSGHADALPAVRVLP